jgi:fucose 4-O-acetylase-like acetyltransferase
MSVERIEGINFLKCIGIIAVILGHITSPFAAFIFSWHMPLFFILSGFFIKIELSPANFFNKEFKRLIVSYFFFAFLGLTIESIKRLLLGREPLNFSNEFVGVFIWMDMDALINSYAFVLWFLPALFVARYTTYLILKYIKIKFIQGFVVLSAFSISFIVQLPFAIDNGLNALLFVWLGYYLYDEGKKIWPVSLVMLSLIYLVYGVPELNMALKNYDQIVLNVIWSVSIASLLSFCVSKLKNLYWLINLWGANTLILFTLHPYSNNISVVLLDKLGHPEWYLKLLLSLILLQLVIIVKNKWSHRKISSYV